ncbi:MAG: hypothetical protein COA44_15560 [Arcobacter sp.]|nr:MAG: hypothetical protein COA44_15560 [Arcobacter sp.]
MRQSFILILISLHLLASTIYAKTTFFEQGHAYTNKCDRHENLDTHEHHHFHNGSQHTHKHSHSQVNINFLDFFTLLQDKDLFIKADSKQLYFESAFWIPDPILESLFRPPKA